MGTRLSGISYCRYSGRRSAARAGSCEGTFSCRVEGHACGLTPVVPPDVWGQSLHWASRLPTFRAVRTRAWIDRVNVGKLVGGLPPDTPLCLRKLVKTIPRFQSLGYTRFTQPEYRYPSRINCNGGFNVYVPAKNRGYAPEPPVCKLYFGFIPHIAPAPL